MAASKDSVPHLGHVTITKETPEADIRKLLQVIRPDWSEAKLSINGLGGGNSADKYWVRQEGGSEDGIVVRVRRFFHNDRGSSFVNPEFENKTVQHLSKVGIFPKVFATFENGYCYSYVQGKPLVQLTKPKETPPLQDLPLKEISETLAHIHMFKLSDEDYSTTNYFDRTYELLETEYGVGSANLIDKAEIKRELDILVDTCKKHFKLNIVHCHGDLHTGNMLWNKETNHITFMDWEMTHKGYQVNDVASLIHSMHFSEVMPIPGIPVSPNPAETKRLVARYYYDKWCELNVNNTDIYSYEFEEFFKMITFFQSIYLLKFVILLGSVVSRKKELTSDYESNVCDMITLMKTVYDYYLKIKEDQLQLVNNN